MDDETQAWQPPELSGPPQAEGGEPLPQDATHGLIQRPGSTPADYAGDWQPPEMKPTLVEQQLKEFNYSKSPLRHVMSETTARAVVQAALKQEGVKTTLDNNIVNAGLFFLNDNVKNHMSTALSALGSKQSWDDLANQYGKLREAQNTENPTAARVGKNIGQTATAVTAAAALNPRISQPAMETALRASSAGFTAAKNAASTAMGAVLPIAKKAAYWTLHGAALGLGYKAFDKIAESLK